ncbi:sodium-coupled monocarboxylate transporter 2-like [Lutzomyia longipalpis]|uniref:sodium-coupled monocarboxylate transporter 2-like n=1 Tax=Lutzomyia longipalpis TaxID=7200 RepID=UPI002483BC18|nr:sodium-coupled monocarboxylate transporter 2-like [Lutzomyia longipalpis]
MDPGQFSLLDYIFFVIVIVVSSSIGLYYAIKLRKTVTTVDDYLLGGRNMRLLPVACSLAATSLTAMASVGIIAEIYAYGTYVWIVSYGVVVMGIFLSWIFLPIFSELKLTSVFKYFELRFNRRVRLLASGLFLLSGLMYLSVTVYVPALTFQRVTGINTYVTIIVLSLICAIYTAIGGLRAVIWTDVVQLVFMFSSIVVIIFVGVNSANGFDNVIDAARQGGRLYFVNYKSINARSSIWSHAFSTVFLMIYQYGLSQTNIQRFMSFPNLRKMRISVWILVAVFSFYNFLIVILGIVLYANYESCDPYRAGFIKRIDHILPHFIQEKASLFLGFNGIFIAGIFSASLSTTSSYLNAMSGIIYEDFISPLYPRMKENMAGRIMKTTVFILAVLQIGLVFFIERMGSIAQIVSQCMSLNACTMITLFTLGVFIPKANSKVPFY